MKSTRTAIVIPAFFHTGWTIANGTLEEQVNSILHRIPFTMEELMHCVDIQKCAPRKKNLFTHVGKQLSITSIIHNIFECKESYCSTMFPILGFMTNEGKSSKCFMNTNVGQTICKNRTIDHIV